jgi:hypothetical protein
MRQIALLRNGKMLTSIVIGFWINHTKVHTESAAANSSKINPSSFWISQI